MRLPIITAICFALLSLPQVARANPQLAAIPGARANMDLLAPQPFQSKKFN